MKKKITFDLRHRVYIKNKQIYNLLAHAQIN